MTTILNDNELLALLGAVDGLREAANQPLWNSTTDAAYTLALLDHYPTLATALRERLGESDLSKLISQIEAKRVGLRSESGSSEAEFLACDSYDRGLTDAADILRASSSSSLAGEAEKEIPGR